MIDTKRYEQVIYNLTELLKAKTENLYFWEDVAKSLQEKLEELKKELSEKEEQILKYMGGKLE